MKKIAVKHGIALLRIIRLLLSTDDVCIYPVRCLTYAESVLLSRSVVIAVPLILVRVLSCNPLVGLARYAWFSCKT